MKKILENKINKFLSERRNSVGGGWAQITSQDVLSLYDIIDLLIQEKCEKDADGDLPIEFKLINRRTHEKLRFSPIPYYGVSSKEEDSPEKMDLIQEELMYNLTRATSELDQFYRHQRFLKQEKLYQQKDKK